MTVVAIETNPNQKLINNLCEALRKTDDVALYNVTHDKNGASILDTQGNPIEGRDPRGGPFGAGLVLSFEDQSVQYVGEFRGNKVIDTGIASKHAEDSAMESDNISLLIGALEKYKKAKREVTVWLITSGQSCIDCDSKQEILDRYLVANNLIPPDHFNSLYGATYDQTSRITRFFDIEYADALIFSLKKPKHPANRVRHEHVKLSDVPGPVKFIMEKALSPTAVVFRDDRIYSLGHDERTLYSLFATPEVVAIQNACKKYRKEGHFESWKVGGILFTTTDELGSLAWSEIAWTGIPTVKSVEFPKSKMPVHMTAPRNLQAMEAAEISNLKLREAIGGGYHNALRAGGVYRDSGFENRAQPAWAEYLKTNSRSLYNGGAVSDDVLAMRNCYTRFDFAAFDIKDYGRIFHGSMPQPLAPLAGPR